MRHQPVFDLFHVVRRNLTNLYNVVSPVVRDKLLEGELHFVCGFDSAVQMDTWYEGTEILSKYPIITARRPDTDYAEGMKTIESFREKYGADITVLEMAPVDDSSTQVRNLVKEGKSITGLVPPGVEEYIIEHKLYK